MDNCWERSIPFFKIAKSDLADIFRRFDPKLQIISGVEVNTGCRNSNYIIKTSAGVYFFRVFPPHDNSYLNEIAVNQDLCHKVAVPEIYCVTEFQNRGCLIYQHIESASLQSRFTDSGRLENDIVRQVAQNAAAIHNFKANDFPGLIPMDLPPFTEWYNLFLTNPRAQARLGQTIVKRVRCLVQASASQLQAINRYQGFIHGDFRPANMLIDGRGKVYIVDWEFPGNGHILADIGQFFRYRSCFDQEHLRVFETEYNQRTQDALPTDWPQLSRLRDLVNPLQMIGAEGELPLKYQDLNALVLDTLKAFGY